MSNFNPYDELSFRSTFSRTEIYNSIRQDYSEEKLSWKKYFDTSIITGPDSLISDVLVTPREIIQEYFSLSIFYYILPLLEPGYDIIYDLGCGKNMFKPYIPKLLGVGAEEAAAVKWYNDVRDPTWPDIGSRKDFEMLPSWIKKECTETHKLVFPKNQFYGDIHGFVDDQYLCTHQNYYHRVFSICALHFHPIDSFKKVVEDFYSMIRPGGRGFLAINIQRMLDRTSPSTMISLFGKPECENTDLIEDYIHVELEKIKNPKWLIIDVDLAILNEGIDGNVRLVFEK